MDERRQSATKQRILDTAERLFAARGVHSTSLRGLTAEAKVNLAAVNYHFGSKEALLQAVFERRLIPLNKAQRDRLEAVRKNAQAVSARPSVRDALHAFFEPLLSAPDSGPAAENFLRLLGRSFTEPDETVRKITLRHMGPVLILLFDISTQALPHLPRDCLFWRLNLALGTMTHALSVNFSALPPSVTLPRSTFMSGLILDFLTAGLEAPYTGNSSRMEQPAQVFGDT